MAKVKVVKDNAERWLLTYADLMNLLLILFIILYTMSKVDQGRYQQVAQSLRSVLGISAGEKIEGESNGGNSIIDLGGNAPQSVDTGEIINAEEVQMKMVERKVKEIIQKEGLQGNVEVSIQERGVVISIKEKILFRSGSAEIEADSEPTIEKIGKVLLAVPGKQIRIEGHTDTDPIKTSKYPDNQELSTARANSVLRILAGKVGIDPKITSATGYGEYRPIAPNDTPENKAKNRRVDITILRDKYDLSEAGVDSAELDIQPAEEAGAPPAESQSSGID